MCRAPRPALSQLPVEPASSQLVPDDPVPVGLPVFDSSVPPAQVQCPSCTYLNHANARLCVMCEVVLPGMAQQPARGVEQGRQQQLSAALSAYDPLQARERQDQARQAQMAAEARVRQAREQEQERQAQAAADERARVQAAADERATQAAADERARVQAAADERARRAQSDAAEAAERARRAQATTEESRTAALIALLQAQETRPMVLHELEAALAAAVDAGVEEVDLTLARSLIRTARTAHDRRGQNEASRSAPVLPSTAPPTTVPPLTRYSSSEVDIQLAAARAEEERLAQAAAEAARARVALEARHARARSSSQRWACPRCTSENEGRAERCMVCQAGNPLLIDVRFDELLAELGPVLAADGEARRLADLGRALFRCFGTPQRAFPLWALSAQYLREHERFACEVLVFVDDTCLRDAAQTRLVHRLLREREPTNLAMVRSHDEEKFAALLQTPLVTGGSWERAPGAARFSVYVAHYEETGMLAPNVALYCETPALPYARANDRADFNAASGVVLRVLNVVGFAFDNDEQPDARYFGTPAQGMAPQPDPLEAAMRTVFAKILACVRHFQGTPKPIHWLHVPEFGTGAFAGTQGVRVRAIWGQLWSQLLAALPDGVQASKEAIYTDGHFSANTLRPFTTWRSYRDLSSRLFVNAWDPHTLIGNANFDDPSMDGYYGRSTAMALLGWSCTNPHLERNLVGVAADTLPPPVSFEAAIAALHMDETPGPAITALTFAREHISHAISSSAVRRVSSDNLDRMLEIEGGATLLAAVGFQPNANRDVYTIPADVSPAALRATNASIDEALEQAQQLLEALRLSVDVMDTSDHGGSSTVLELSEDSATTRGLHGTLDRSAGDYAVLVLMPGLAQCPFVGCEPRPDLLGARKVFDMLGKYLEKIVQDPRDSARRRIKKTNVHMAALLLTPGVRLVLKGCGFIERYEVGGAGDERGERVLVLPDDAQLGPVQEALDRLRVLSAQRLDARTSDEGEWAAEPAADRVERERMLVQRQALQAEQVGTLTIRARQALIADHDGEDATERLRPLLENGLNPDSMDLLAVAILGDKYGCVEMLIRAGASVLSDGEGTGRTPLLLACAKQQGGLRMLKTVLRCGQNQLRSHPEVWTRTCTDLDLNKTPRQLLWITLIPSTGNEQVRARRKHLNRFRYPLLFPSFALSPLLVTVLIDRVGCVQAGDVSEPFAEETDEVLRFAARGGVTIPPVCATDPGKDEREDFDRMVTELCKQHEANALRVLVDELGYCGGAQLTNFHRNENGVRRDVSEAAFVMAVRHGSIAAIYALAPGGGADEYHDSVISAFQLAAYDTPNINICADETLSAALMMAGADPNTYDRTGMATPLGKALVKGESGRKWYTLAIAAIDAGADACLPYRSDDLTTSIIYRLAGLDEAAPLAFFLQAADPASAHRAACHTDSDGEFPLWHAVRRGNKEAVALLLKHRANPNQTISMAEAHGRGLLHQCALDMAQLPIIRLLLAAGADCNAVGPTGVESPQVGTPLLFAVNAGLPEMVKELIERGGADPLARLNDGLSVEVYIQSNAAEVRRAIADATRATQRDGPRLYTGELVDRTCASAEFFAKEQIERSRAKLLGMATWVNHVMASRVSLKNHADQLGMSPNEMMRMVHAFPDQAVAFGLPPFYVPTSPNPHANPVGGTSASTPSAAVTSQPGTASSAAGSSAPPRSNLSDGLADAVEESEGMRNFFPSQWLPAAKFREAIQPFGHTEEEVDVLEQKGASHNVGQRMRNDMVAALFAYTEENDHQLYRRLNEACRENNEAIVQYRHFLYKCEPACARCCLPQRYRSPHACKLLTARLRLVSDSLAGSIRRGHSCPQLQSAIQTSFVVLTSVSSRMSPPSTLQAKL